MFGLAINILLVWQYTMYIPSSSVYHSPKFTGFIKYKVHTNKQLLQAMFIIYCTFKYDSTRPLKISLPTNRRVAENFRSVNHDMVR
jgi:hypothetical protein